MPADERSLRSGNLPLHIGNVSFEREALWREIRRREGSNLNITPKGQGQGGGAAGDDQAVGVEAGLALEDADARR